MARQGRAGSALAIAALGSFFAGTVATAIIATFAPPLAKVGQSFGAPEYFSLMVLGLVAAVVLAHGSVIKAIAMIILGLLLGLVGTDGNTGARPAGSHLTEPRDHGPLRVLQASLAAIPMITGMCLPGMTSSTPPAAP